MPWKGEKDKSLTSITHFTKSVGSKFFTQLINTFLKKEVKNMVLEIPDIVLNKKITIKGLQLYVNCFYFLIAYPSSHGCVQITLVLNFDNAQIWQQYKELQVACYFSRIVDTISETPKDLSVTQIPFVGVPGYPTS